MGGKLDHSVSYVKDGVRHKDDYYNGAWVEVDQNGGGDHEGYTLEITRFDESSDATLSRFVLTKKGYDPVKGYILEPGGPSTTKSGQDKRIPEGIYNIDPYSSKKHPDNYIISNDQVSLTRYILIHKGNYNGDTAGCLLPGSSYSMVNGNIAVWSSGNMLDSMRTIMGSGCGTLIVNDLYCTP